MDISCFFFFKFSDDDTLTTDTDDVFTDLFQVEELQQIDDNLHIGFQDPEKRPESRTVDPYERSSIVWNWLIWVQAFKKNMKLIWRRIYRICPLSDLRKGWRLKEFRQNFDIHVQ